MEEINAQEQLFLNYHCNDCPPGSRFVCINYIHSYTSYFRAFLKYIFKTLLAFVAILCSSLEAEDYQRKSHQEH